MTLKEMTPFQIKRQQDETFTLAETKLSIEELEKVKKYLKENNPLPLMLQTFQKQHLGDEALGLLHVIAPHCLGLTENNELLHVYTIGPSGSGKTHAALTARKLFPDYRSMELASFSEKSLFYASQQKRLDGLILHQPEIAFNKDCEEKMALLRILLDSNPKSRPEHWTLNTQREFISLKLDGRVCMWFNSETAISDCQIKNRLLLASTSTNPEMDEKINDFQLSQIGLLQREKSCEDFVFCKNINELLLQNVCEILVPFAKAISFPAGANKRMLPLFLVLLKCITKMNYYRRPLLYLKQGDSEIPGLIAYPEDFFIAAALWNEITPILYSQVSRPALQLLDLIPIGSGNACNKLGLQLLSGLASESCSKYSRELYKAGLISAEKREHGQYYYWNDARNARIKVGIRPEMAYNAFKSGFDAIQACSDKKIETQELWFEADYLRSAENVPSILKCLNLPIGEVLSGLRSDSERIPSIPTCCKNSEIDEINENHEIDEKDNNCMNCMNFTVPSTPECINSQCSLKEKEVDSDG